MLFFIIFILILIFFLLMIGRHFKYKKKIIQTYSVQNFIHLDQTKSYNEETIVEKINDFFETNENEGDESDSSEDTGDE